MKEIYLDNAATTPVVPPVAEAVMEYIQNDYGNPSSLHRLGIRAEKRIKEAKGTVASFINVDPDDIYFTSGGTEGNNLCIVGYVNKMHKRGKHLITTSIEHPSVLNTFNYLEEKGFEVTYLPVNSQGIIEMEALEESIRPDTLLVSIMHVNNETGAVQPIEKIAQVLKGLKNKPALHVDGVQSLGKIPLDPLGWGVDLMTFSGHKIHALKGIGFIYKKKGIRLEPLQWGGGQEMGVRAGTENLAGIVSINAALKWIGDNFSQTDRLYRLKDRLVDSLQKACPYVVFNGVTDKSSAPHIISVAVPGLRGEVILHALEDKGIYVSTGSACSSRSKKHSHVLQAMGLDSDIVEGSIRVSLSYTTDEDEIDCFVETFDDIVGILRKYTRR